MPDEILGDERTVDAIDDVKQENCVEEAEGVNAEADSSETTKPETLLKGEAGFQYKPQVQLSSYPVAYIAYGESWLVDRRC